jgi:hypothetical protein
MEAHLWLMVITDKRSDLGFMLIYIALAGKGLEQLTTDALAEGFQVSDNNPLLGVDSRADLLRRLGRSLLSHPDVFGEAGRPGMLVGK